MLQAHRDGQTGEIKAVAERVFWSFVVSHVPDPAVALHKLRVVDRLHVYEPLLRSRADELFGAQFNEAIVAGTDDDDYGESGDMANELG